MRKAISHLHNEEQLFKFLQKSLKTVTQSSKSQTETKDSKAAEVKSSLLLPGAKGHLGSWKAVLLMSLLQHTWSLKPKIFLGVSIVFLLWAPSLPVCTHTSTSMTVAMSEQHCSWNPSASITKGLQCCILLRALQWKRELTCCRCSVESLHTVILWKVFSSSR